MKVPLYSYRDTLVGFGTPIVDINDQTAIRGFSMQMNNPSSMNNFSPKDFDLYRIGVYETDTGLIEPETVPILICNGTSVIGVNNEKNK